MTYTKPQEAIDLLKKEFGCFLQSTHQYPGCFESIIQIPYSESRWTTYRRDPAYSVEGEIHFEMPKLDAKLTETFHNPHVPNQVIYNGTTTIAIFPDGKKIKSRPDKGATFDKETGLAMCIVKHVYGTRSKFLKAIEKANDQNKEKK